MGLRFKEGVVIYRRLLSLGHFGNGRKLSRELSSNYHEKPQYVPRTDGRVGDNGVCQGMLTGTSDVDCTVRRDNTSSSPSQAVCTTYI